MDLPEAAKDRGNIAEMAFALEARKRSFTVLLPLGDNCKMDVVLYKNGKFSRVQIKSCLKREPGRNRWNFTVRCGGKHSDGVYSKEQIDFLALYAFDADWWIILPVEEIGISKSIKIDDGGKYDIFKGQWKQLE